MESPLTSLLEREERFRLLSEITFEGAVVIENGVVADCNRAFAQLAGRDGGELIGLDMLDLMTAGSREAVRQGLEGEGVRHCEARLVVAGGSSAPVEMTFRRIPYGGGEATVATIRDLTERKEAEKALRAYREHLEDLVAERTAALKLAEERLLTALDSFDGGFALFDGRDHLVIANEEFRGFVPEVASAEQRTLTVGELLRRMAAARGLDERWVAAWLERFRKSRFQAERQLADGRWVDINLRRTPDGGALFIFTDITQHKRAEEALREALEKERTLVARQRDFVSVASHEFRTPLAIIDAAAQRMLRRRERLAAEEFEDLGQEIRAAVARMVGLIDTILGASRLDAGGFAFEPRPCDPRAVISGVVKRQADLVAGREFRVDVDGLPEAVTGDPALLDQIFTNLLANAVKYSPAGGPIEIVGRTEGRGTGGQATEGQAVVTVTDHGLGIPAEDMPRIFQRFFRARTATGIAGTGIGLSFVKRLVEMHGGEIAIDSIEGRGTTVTVRLRD